MTEGLAIVEQPTELPNVTTAPPAVKRRPRGGPVDGIHPMICPPHPPSPIVQHWLARHRDPASRALHMVGIPPTVLGVVLMPIYLFLGSLPVFLLALAAFVGGYQLQFLGHIWDGTESGEMRSLKRFARARLGWPPALPVAGARVPRRGGVA